MKKFYILLIALLMASGAAAQSCLPEGITFNTQAQIDNFQINYPNCTEIEGDVLISGDDITNLNGLSILTSIGSAISIENNTALTSLTGLENLNTIGGDLRIGINFVGWGQPNPNLTDISALGNITFVGQSLRIGSNNSLFSLAGLENLTSIGWALEISNNNSLTSLTGLDNINAGSIGNLTIVGNELLSTCDVQSICDYLVSPNGEVVIEGNATGCNSQEEVEEDCANNCLPEGIIFNTQAQIDSFQIVHPNCTEIEGNVTIHSWDSITNLNGLSVVSSIGGDIYIYENFALTNLTGLDGLTSIGGDLVIDDNSSLTSLTGLGGLTSIGGDLTIGREGMKFCIGNHSLTSLEDLSNLISIGGALNVDCNDSLTSLTGLDNIDAGSITDLHIFFNYSLSTCEVQSVCDYLAIPNGNVYISNNANGCEDEGDVLLACWLGVDQSTVSSRRSAVIIYPNPTSTTITLSTPTTPQKNTFMTIYNINGQALLSRQITEPIINVDVSGLSQGVYFVRVISDDGVSVGKFVKQ